ncbi:MAG TPA: restriction endonuclease subunit S [Chitinophagaceae bacterium]
MKQRIGDIIYFNPSHSLRNAEEYEFIMMENITPGFKYAFPAGLKKGGSSGSKFKNSDTIFARITPCLENGKIAEVKGLKNDIGIGSTEFFVFRNREGITDSKFIYYLALTRDVREIAEKSMQGASGRQRALREPIENYEFSLPPLPIQRRIASILSTYDDLIENNVQRIKLLDYASRCEYKMLMEESETTNMKLGDVCALIMGQSPPSDTYNDLKDGLPFHQGVTNFGFRFVQHKIYCSKPARVAQEGDILMSVRAPVGRLNFATDSICVGRGVSAIRHKDGLQQLQYQILKDFFSIEDRIGNGAIFNATTKSEMENLELAYPLSKRAIEVEQKLQVMQNQMLNLTKQIAKLCHARDMLLPKLMSGEIDLSDQVHEAKIIQMPIPVSEIAEDEEVYETKKPKTGAQYYLRSVLAAYLVDALWQENTFGHVKLMKMMYLCEYLAGIETVSNYHRDAAGPYDNQMIRSIDKQLKEKQWFEMYKNQQGFPKYKPMAKRGEYKTEFEKYYSDKQIGIDNLLAIFGKLPTEKAEMVATIYEVWRDLGTKQTAVNEDEIVNEVLNNWHDNKKLISEDRWRKCYGWMKEQNWIT